jgi:hypothetical protein
MPRKPRFAQSLIVIGFSIALLSCAAVLDRDTAQGETVASGPRLDHAAHLDRELECSDCHWLDDDPASAAEQMFEMCMLCHEDMEEEWPEEKRLVGTFWSSEGAPLWTRMSTPLIADIKFAHEKHEKLECLDCHQAMVSGDRPTGPMLPMKACQDCHTSRGAPNDCTTCHTDIQEGAMPDSHRFMWIERHGRTVKGEGGGSTATCAQCHTSESFCIDCHKDEPPQSHTNLFRTRTHGVLVAMDRASCTSCHDGDGCARCHDETPPRSHRGQWARGRSTHCGTCHFPVRSEESCRVCHKIEPVHITAADQPDWHDPASDCNLCHTPPGLLGAPPRPHVDNGLPCSYCHRPQ